MYLGTDFITDLHRFADQYDPALQNAAYLLGGQPGLRRTQRWLDDMATTRLLTPRLRQETLALHDLLTLENVHKLDSIEAACFAEIDPASPIVEDICLLADMLFDAMQTSGFEMAESNQPSEHHLVALDGGLA